MPRYCFICLSRLFALLVAGCLLCSQSTRATAEPTKSQPPESAVANSLATATGAASQNAVTADGSYAVVCSAATRKDDKWGPVVTALAKKHGGSILVYEKDVAEVLPKLKKQFPRYIGFVAQPKETPREFVVKVHRLTRQLDDDPYTDALWGIVTGYDAASAMRIVQASEPLLIRRAAAGTGGFDLRPFVEGYKFSEDHAGVYWHMKDAKEQKLKGPTDSTKAIVDMLNNFKPQAFATSGHATERDWQLGYSYKNGQFRCKDGVLLGIDTKRGVHPVRSPNPKVYLPAGNCLMGHIRDQQSIALAWMNSAGVNQMFGYVVSTWYGHGGWGTKEYFLDLAGRYSLSDAFYFNNQTIVHDLHKKFPATADKQFDKFGIERDPRLLGRLAASLGYKKWDNEVKNNVGLLWDRDTVAFYGDPAWQARIAAKPALTTRLVEKDGTYTFEIQANRKVTPHKPLAMLLPHRVTDVTITSGKGYEPLVTDNFLMLLKKTEFEPGKTYQVQFRARPL